MTLPEITSMARCPSSENARRDGSNERRQDHLDAVSSSEERAGTMEPSYASTVVDAPSPQAERHKEQLKAHVPKVLVLSTLSTTLSLLCLCGLTSYLYFTQSFRETPPPPASPTELPSTKQSQLDETTDNREKESSGLEDAGESADEHEGLPPVPFISPFVPIWGLQDIPLLGVQNMGTLTLKWNDRDTDQATEMVFHVDSIIRSYSDTRSGVDSRVPLRTTTLCLSGGHKFVVKKDRADLYDPAGRLIHAMFRDAETSDSLRPPPLDELTPSVNSEAINADSTEAARSTSQFLMQRRRLQLLGDGMRGGLKKTKKPKGFAPTMLPNGPPGKGGGPPTSFMDAYCRYGCGGMSVTFPYYYRPFFGYGFPLVGTEAMFPQGYGGYPAAPLLASQGGVPAVTGAGGPIIAGGTPGGSLTPGIGGTNVLGGVPAIPVALSGI